MAKYKVDYQAGEGRYTNGTVDYMLVWVDDIRLYAELPTNEDDECGTYDDLREQILEQAREYEINHEKLEFWFDS